MPTLGEHTPARDVIVLAAVFRYNAATTMNERLLPSVATDETKRTCKRA
jgi:hypothetical protein